ncbi:MAG: hypothetical protein PF503_16060 [Desulfobacula sp.]|nr:hypothetical protein [Desulfobacula sp.]
MDYKEKNARNVENDIDIRGITRIEQNKGFNIVAIVTDQDDKAMKIQEHTLVQ